MRVPIVRQTAEHTCGEAVVESIRRHYGMPPSRRRFASEIDGSCPRTVEHQLRRGGFNVISGNFTWRTLRYFVGRRLPVICCRQGHWLVITAMERRSLVLMDPMFDGYVTESMVSFKRRWQDWDSMATEYRSWAIVPDPMEF